MAGVIDRRPAAVAFLGLGLIGGSIARALTLDPRTGRRLESRPRITAWTPSGHGPAAALQDGVIDRAAADPAEAIAEADLVVIAAPPLETIGLLERLGSDLRASLGGKTLVTDVTSTKGAIMSAAAAAGIPFVGGHPMAGRETAGYESASEGLFVDRPWVIVTPEGGPEATGDPVRWLASACGARAVSLTAATHDAATAAISHLPLIAAAALVEAVAGSSNVDWSLARELAASGWQGMTRLARGDARMGAGIAATNAAALTGALRAYRDVLDAWLASLEGRDAPDAAALERRFQAARIRLEEPETSAG